jgi:hypothetical protein
MIEKGSKPHPLAGLGDAFRPWVVLTGGLYTIGLLIVNLDLGRYGIVTLELARTEYVMAGALWFFLNASTLALVTGVILQSKTLAGRLFWGLLVLLGWSVFLLGALGCSPNPASIFVKVCVALIVSATVVGVWSFNLLERLMCR